MRGEKDKWGYEGDKEESEATVLGLIDTILCYGSEAGRGTQRGGVVVTRDKRADGQ